VWGWGVGAGGGEPRAATRIAVSLFHGSMQGWKEDELWDAVSQKNPDLVRAALRKVYA
jgi:hypothetical protein